LLLSPFLLAAKPFSAKVVFLRWLRHLGGPGLILVGILDNSVLPLPGSMDVFVIVLAAGQRDCWPYYAFMGTLGAVVGGSLTYRLARREGKGHLSKRLKHGQMDRIHRAFEKWGFLAIAVPALIPPPFPMTPFLIAAGAAQYSRQKFIASLFLGRGIRYTILASLAGFFGRQILTFFSRHAMPVMWTMIAVVIAGIGLAIFRAKFRHSRHA
jgi:membrane protein DedA with SNARE-associated domain